MSKNIIQNSFMLEALNQAKIALEFDEVPVGAVIVEDNQIIATGFNQNRQKCDPTCHAEIVALRNVVVTSIACGAYHCLCLSDRDGRLPYCLRKDMLGIYMKRIQMFLKKRVWVL
jgi:pyrimidine deaminase RibD-like protein